MTKIILLTFNLLVVILVNAQDNKKAFEAGRSVGKIVGLLLLILLSIWLIRWSARQRKKGK